MSEKWPGIKGKMQEYGLAYRLEPQQMLPVIANQQVVVANVETVDGERLSYVGYYAEGADVVAQHIKTRRPSFFKITGVYIVNAERIK